ncbi:MAG TPA: FG-GAP-like repeat-containing protein, partial [bacterium]|nr:FG-GAP-like repeat-containing protein [bacterium]
TNNFGGTSSAAAMVGGAVTQIQSYARASLGNRRFIMPLKMREIVTSTGVSQVGTGCNIGKQPRVDQALNAVDAFLASARSSYPELDSGDMLTAARYVTMRAMGVGIICKKWDPFGSDPICPDSEIFPEGEGIAKKLDFDADGRADLVQWTNGSWKLDLSSRGPGGDNYGEWDIEIEHPPIPGRWVWPYVIDMNSDGRTDFVIYDKENGKFHIRFTDTALLRDGTWEGWDWEIDYSAEWKDDLKLNPLACTTGTGPNCSNYSRPALGDYNNDGWNDIAIACSDGFWRIDHGGPDRGEFGSFDSEVRYLTEAQLASAPGWAYTSATEVFETRSMMIYKSPTDETAGINLPEAGRIFVQHPLDFTHEYDWADGSPHAFGGNDDINLFGKFCYTYQTSTSVKSADGLWLMGKFYPGYLSDFSFLDVYPAAGWGGTECIPAVADYNGDGLDDRAVMCPNEWRISYSQGTDGCDTPDADIVSIPLGYDAKSFTLPGRSYSGGVSYAWVKQFIEDYQDLHPGTPPPIPVDMPSAH